jgi:ABC-type dipeptide/oligopeptide/nickel transport system permease component
MFQTLLEKLGPWGPLLFGLAFVAPVIGDLLPRLGFTTILGLPAILIGVIIGAVTGFVASRRRSWL